MKQNTLHGDFILIGINSLRLIIDRSESTSVNHLEDKVFAQSNWVSDSVILKSSLEENRHYFTAISSQFRLLAKFPDDRFVITSFISIPNLHFCWKEIQLLNNVTLVIEDFPELLKAEYTPFTSITKLKDGSPAFICNSEKLLNFIKSQ